MKKILHNTFALILLALTTPSALLSTTAFAQQAPVDTGGRPPPNAANYHGSNSLQPSDDLATGRRRFEAGAYTSWHIHPGGQLLFNEEGTGVVQRLGQPLKVLRAGETDFTPAGVPHWHGAAPQDHAIMSMVHFGGIGPWLDPVGGDVYAEETRRAGLPASGQTDQPASGSPNYVGETSSLPSDHLQAARGRFEADAYSFWHVHPRGQVVFAEKGPVILQKRGEPMQILQEGEADFTPPGVAHWHGSGPYSYALKVVLGFGAPTNWLGEPVSEEEYAEARRFFRDEP